MAARVTAAVLRALITLDTACRAAGRLVRKDIAPFPEAVRTAWRRGGF